MGGRGKIEVKSEISSARGESSLYTVGIGILARRVISSGKGERSKS